ncbi:hypothetical protein Tco_0272159 [Tanacetum coccineum]
MSVHSLNDWRIDYGPWITIELTRIASLAIRDRDICASFVRAISAKPSFSCASLPANVTLEETMNSIHFFRAHFNCKTGITSLIHIESRKSPTAVLFDVDTERISIVTVNTKEYYSDVMAESQG